MKILLFGKNGQLGLELQRTLLPLGPITAIDKEDLDLANLDALKAFIQQLKPEVIINASAYTAVDRAESESDLAFQINAQAPGAMAQAANQLGAIFIHFSTDYVFDGKKGAPYNEDDLPNPLNTYGKSKLAGETLALAAGGAVLVFRTSWVYGHAAESFAAKVLSWARQRETLQIVDDQIGSPTWARFLAETSSAVLARYSFQALKAKSGMYHLAGKGSVSRLDFARAILALDPHPEEQRCTHILPAKTDDFPTPALRPLFTALDCARFESTFALYLPEWQQSLQLALRP